MVLDLTAFEKAVQSLQEVLGAYDQAPNAFMRDACIQRFEYTYELAHKMLRRQLEQMAGGSDEVDQMTFPTLIRTGAEKGLLRSSWDVWKMHRDARNCSTNIDMAEMVFNQISSFYREAKFLVSQLRSIN